MGGIGNLTIVYNSQKWKFRFGLSAMKTTSLELQNLNASEIGLGSLTKFAVNAYNCRNVGNEKSEEEMDVFLDDLTKEQLAQLTGTLWKSQEELGKLLNPPDTNQIPVEEGMIAAEEGMIAAEEFQRLQSFKNGIEETLLSKDD